MRVGIDIDGVLADMEGALSNMPPGQLSADFWERLPELEPGMVSQLAEITAAERWEVSFITRRPETSGAPAQIQTERWLERHGFAQPRVHIVRGSRGELVHALGLDLLIDDTLENCLDAALRSKAASVLIWRGDATTARKSLRGMNVDIAESLGNVLEKMTGRVLVRNRTTSTSAPTSPIASADRSVFAAEYAITPSAALADRADASAGASSSPAPSSAAPTVLTRRTFAIAALVFGAFAVYGSLVPLEFQAVKLGDALDRYSKLPYLHLGIQSRADFVANILLFVPLGFLLMGALRVDRRGRIAAAVSTVLIAGFACALANAIEFTQIYFPRRTVSLNDIVAETTGAAVGIVLWVLFGTGLTEWARAFLGERSRPILMARLLAAYGAAFLGAQLMPFDVTIDPGELAQKFNEGRITLIPFGHSYPSVVVAMWDLGSDLLLWIPIGALACIGWTRPGTRRSPARAVAISVMLACVIEVAQVFIFTRYADPTDVITAALGITCGVIAMGWSAMSAAPVARQPQYGLNLWPSGALLLWIAALATYYWAPFDFVISRDALSEGLTRLWVAPFHNYYLGSEFHAFTELSRKLLLAAPVGALLRLTAPPSANVSVARLQRTVLLAFALIVFAVLEAGQIFLPGRIADATDVLIAITGVEAGRWIIGRLRESDPPVENTKAGVDDGAYERPVNGVGYARR